MIDWPLARIVDAPRARIGKVRALCPCNACLLPTPNEPMHKVPCNGEGLPQRNQDNNPQMIQATPFLRIVN
jgi:hypothetical protein